MYNVYMESSFTFSNTKKYSPDVEKVLTFYRNISDSLMIRTSPDGSPVKEYVPIKSIVLGRFDSSTSSMVYTVKSENNKITCTCPGYTYRRHCKHMELV